MKVVNTPSLFSGLDDTEKFKLYRQLWKEAADYEVLTSFPIHLDIELSGVCNLKCESCFQHLIEEPLGLMKLDLYKKIIDEGVQKGLCAIKLQIRGESFLNPNLFDCITYAKEKGILDVQITTNATLLNADNIPRVLDSGLDAIIFSVDGHHSDSLEKKRRAKTYSAVERSIRDLLKLRQEFGKTKPWVRLQSSIKATDRESFKQSKNYIKEKFPEADVFVVSRIFNYQDDTDAYPDLHVNYKLNPCNYLMHRLAVFWDGDITTCCGDYNNRFQLGNANTQPIEEVWQSEKMNNFRKLHFEDKRTKMPICKHCGACISVKNDAVTQDTTKCHIADYASHEDSSISSHPMPQ